MRRIGWNIFGLLPGTSEETNPTPSLMVMGLGKVIEILVLKSVPQKSVLMDDERDWIKHTNEIMSKSDTDGTPLVYVPRSWAEIQKDMQQVMIKIVNDQRRIADILDRIEKKLEEK